MSSTGKYKRLERRKSQGKLSDNERKEIQNQINNLQAGIEQSVSEYKTANPEKQTPEIEATTNNSNIFKSQSSNPTQRQLNKSIPTSRTLSKTNKQRKQPKSRNTSRNTSKNNSAKLVKH